MYNDLLQKHPIISDQVDKAELGVILRELEYVVDSGIDGDVVEFGCYSGTTSLFITRLLEAKKSPRKLYVYDSFDGLPEKTKEDSSPLGVDFKRGELRATKNVFIENFRKASLPLPRITKAWFHEIDDSQLPDRIAFAFLDGDYYRSIRASLSLVLPRLSQGAVILVDDFNNPKLPGAQKAVYDSLASYTFNLRVECSLAIICQHI